MSTEEEHKAIVGRRFTEFWGKHFSPAVIDGLAAPDIRFEYSMHARATVANRSASSQGRSGPPSSGRRCDRAPAARSHHEDMIMHGDQQRGDAQRSLMDSRTKERIHEAARMAKLRYPGAVGDLLSQDLLSWMVFGHQLGSDLIMRVAAEVLIDDLNI
jgi:hypothetical protein